MISTENHGWISEFPTVTESKKAIKQLSGKALGLDAILTEMYKVIGELH